MATKSVLNGQRRRAWYAARIYVGGRLVAPLSAEYHGKVHTYNYYGCRCDLCSDVARNRQRARVHSVPSPRSQAPEPLRQPEPADTGVSMMEPVFQEPEAQSSTAHLPDPPELDDELPPFTRSARTDITDVEHLRAVLAAYHCPQWSASVRDNETLEVRSAHGHSVGVNTDTGTVVFVSSTEQSTGDEPESLREIHRPKQTRRGGSGSRMPTDYAEVIDRLRELGCTVDTSSARHVKVTLPNGRVRSLPRTTSDWRAVRNTVSQLRADGVDLRRADS